MRPGYFENNPFKTSVNAGPETSHPSPAGNKWAFFAGLAAPFEHTRPPAEELAGMESAGSSLRRIAALGRAGPARVFPDAGVVHPGG